MRANALECDYCHRSSSEEPRQEPMLPLTLLTGLKRCRRCAKEKPLVAFPRDRSRPDGRWHTCRACNRSYWTETGKPLARRRKLERVFQRAETRRTGLAGLRQCARGRGARGIDSLPPDLRFKARQILSDSLARARAEGRHLTQPLIAIRIASAISSAPRKGNRSWARRLRRLKGYRRTERRKMEQEIQSAQWRKTQKANSGPR